MQVPQNGSSTSSSNGQAVGKSTNTGHVRNAVASFYQQQQNLTSNNTLSNSNSLSGLSHANSNGTTGSSLMYSPSNSAGLSKVKQNFLYFYFIESFIVLIFRKQRIYNKPLGIEALPVDYILLHRQVIPELLIMK